MNFHKVNRSCKLFYAFIWEEGFCLWRIVPGGRWQLLSDDMETSVPVKVSSLAHLQGTRISSGSESRPGELALAGIWLFSGLAPTTTIKPCGPKTTGDWWPSGTSAWLGGQVPRQAQGGMSQGTLTWQGTSEHLGLRSGRGIWGWPAHPANPEMWIIVGRS